RRNPTLFPTFLQIARFQRLWYSSGNFAVTSGLKMKTSVGGTCMKRTFVLVLMVLGVAPAIGWAQRIGIETNEKHNVATAERRIKGSPTATMEVAGVKISYPQVQVDPIPGFTNVGGNIKTELAHGEVRVGLPAVLKRIGTFETSKTMRVLDT